MIFETKRLIVRDLKIDDSESYFDMMGNPNVMNPIPRKVMTKSESDKHLRQLIDNDSKKMIWGIEDKKSKSFIGLCALLKNDDQDNELGYRLREKYWGVGYGTEITEGLISYCFNKLKFDKITADVNTANLKSVKILDKLMKPVKEFYNETDQCTDRRYELSNQIH